MDNQLINQISEVYNRMSIYCIISDIREKLKTCKYEKERKQLQEALEYANRRSKYLV
jgi:hypothetical protein